jgi:hypothetical protein
MDGAGRTLTPDVLQDIFFFLNVDCCCDIATTSTLVATIVRPKIDKFFQYLDQV